jgi:hypothetical protein
MLFINFKVLFLKEISFFLSNEGLCFGHLICSFILCFKNRVASSNNKCFVLIILKAGCLRSGC